MIATFIYLEKYKGVLHNEDGNIYEFICETKKGYFEYILLTSLI